MSTARARLPEAARARLGTLVLDGADDPNNTTAAIVVDTLAAKADVLETFPGLAAAAGPAVPGEWVIRPVPELGRAWVVRWDRLTLYVPDVGDTYLPWRLMHHRIMAREYLRRLVVTTAIDLGLDRRRFLKAVR